MEYQDLSMTFIKRENAIIHVALDIEDGTISKVSNTKCLKVCTQINVHTTYQ